MCPTSLLWSFGARACATTVICPAQSAEEGCTFSHINTCPLLRQDFEDYVSQIWQQQRDIFVQVSTDVSRQLKLKRTTRHVIDPRTCKWLFAWDLSSFVCLGFTAVCTPIEVQPLVLQPMFPPVSPLAEPPCSRLTPPLPDLATSGELSQRLGPQLVCGQLGGERLLLVRPCVVLLPRVSGSGRPRWLSR